MVLGPATSSNLGVGAKAIENPRLLARAAPLLAEAAAEYDTTQHFVRRFTWLSYAAQTWAHPRDVVLEVEHGERRPNPRFVVTTLTGFDAGLIYDRAFCPRGQSENHIKDFKNALAADRLSSIASPPTRSGCFSTRSRTG